MSKEIDHAGLLYGILPALYRERDKSGDLEKFLNGCGLLLDQVHNTLRQRYADIFPDSDDAYPIDSQTWLLPYIAALLDVRMVSPLESGRREGIARAIDWRKGKGTLAVAEQIAVHRPQAFRKGIVVVPAGDDLHGAAFLSEIAAMRHETLETRLFRT